MAWPKGRPNPHSSETKKKLSEVLKGRQFSDAHKANLSANHRKKNSLEHNVKVSASMKGRTLSPSHREKIISKVASNWRGGQTGEDFAKVLCPAGFIREYQVSWGSGLGEWFKLDFAHPESKTVIELDGPGHKSTKEYDDLRDAILRRLGWRIIRIRHA